MSDLSNQERCHVITGAAQGIGAAVARHLASAGKRVALIDRADAKVRAVAESLREEGAFARAYAVDVADEAAVVHAITDIEHTCGLVDGLAHAAGVLRAGPTIEQSTDTWREHFDVNVFGALHVCREVGRRMAQRRSGSMVVVSSNAGRTPRMCLAAYASSKAALTMMVKCLGLELAGAGVRCNVVSPGSTNTDMLAALVGETGGHERTLAGSLENYRLGIPLRRIADPRDVADLVVFLLSEQARHITMADVCIDGGATLGQ